MKLKTKLNHQSNLINAYSFKKIKIVLGIKIKIRRISITIIITYKTLVLDSTLQILQFIITHKKRSRNYTSNLGVMSLAFSYTT